jgi:hypothetical protein
MNTAELIQELIGVYDHHGWCLQRVLLRPETRVELEDRSQELFGDARLQESDFDALWFARASHAKREAWELRLIAEQPYALFEAFEANKVESEREEARNEMENRMRENARKKGLF